MELDFAFLADAAEVAGGKLYVLAGAVDTVWADKFPMIIPRMTLVMRFLSTPAEAGRKHTIEIVVVNDDGGKIASVGGTLGAERPPGLPPGMKNAIPVALNFFNMKFERTGSYSIEILVNGFSIKSLPLRVMEQRGQQPQQRPATEI